MCRGLLMSISYYVNLKIKDKVHTKIPYCFNGEKKKEPHGNSSTNKNQKNYQFKTISKKMVIKVHFIL